MLTPTSLDAWLAHCEQLHPTEIDLTLERVQTVLMRLQLRFDAPVITVAGTNGKGSSCAMLESIALAAGYRVGLFSKPHLVHFEERCRVNGQSVTAASLVPHFAAVEQARGDISLSYFEFTLLAIARLLSQTLLDMVILEVGLGGRLDAVNAFDTDCAVITSIALDHTEYLGPDREAIGREKAHIMRPGVPVVISDPAPPQSVLAYAKAIGADWRGVGRDFRHEGDAQQWSWQGRTQRYSGLAYPALRGSNQLANASGVLAVFEALRERLPISAQAVRMGLATVSLPGRFQVIAGQPVVVLDVAHNPHAVAALAHNLDQMGFYPCTHAVLGAMRDKDLPLMIQRMAHLVDRWYFTDLPTARAAKAAELQAAHAEVAEFKAHEKTPGRSQVFSPPSGGLTQSDRSGGSHEITPGRSQVFSPPSGGLTQGDRSGGSHEITPGRSQVFSPPSGGLAQSDRSGGSHEITPGRSQVFSPPSGGLAQSDRSGGALTSTPKPLPRRLNPLGGPDAQRQDGGLAHQALPTCHANPAQALRAAVLAADPADRILVFGSFYTVGGVLSEGLPRLTAKHAQ